jgi:hypothetical protein
MLSGGSTLSRWRRPTATALELFSNESFRLTTASVMLLTVSRTVKAFRLRRWESWTRTESIG